MIHSIMLKLQRLDIIVNSVDNDFDNFIVAIICSLLLGWVAHSSTAHYLPDDWNIWVEFRRVSEKVVTWLERLLRRE